jgi:hypothetical protein
MMTLDRVGMVWYTSEVDRSSRQVVDLQGVPGQSDGPVMTWQ